MRLNDVLESLPELKILKRKNISDEVISFIEQSSWNVGLVTELNYKERSRRDFDWFLTDLGYICFASGNKTLRYLRRLFVKQVKFVGAAPSLNMCTLEAVEALKQAEVCLHDTMFDPSILELISEEAEVVNVGKRCGKHRVTQKEINALILDSVRKGKRVVRLKAGDPGIFGRLCEETDLLTDHELPFKVQAAVSSLSIATTATGILLTRRNLYRGFSVLTPRCAGGKVGSLNVSELNLPVVLFMATHIVRESFNDMLESGMVTNDTPAAVVFDAGTPKQRVVCGTVQSLPDKMDALPRGTGLIYVGEGAVYGNWPNFGVLEGVSVMVNQETSRDLIDEIEERGGKLRWGEKPCPYLSIKALERLSLDTVVRRVRNELEGKVLVCL